MRTIGLYVHMPFCLRKCAYCSFVSFAGREFLIGRYIDAVLAEANIYAPLLQNRVVDTVFIGGGTPSSLEPEQFSSLVNGLKSVCRWQPHEFTIEANPETLSDDKLAAYAGAGASRLSIGLQTHDDAILKSIGRQHSWEVFKKAYETAARRFENINVDIIFGLPGQSIKTHIETLQRVAALSPQHVSAYALKIEPGTPLAQDYAGVGEEEDRAMCHMTEEILTAAGYIHYETSNFAQKGFACRHNLKYWTGGEYLGLGVASHSYINFEKPSRTGNTEDLEAYIAAVMAGQRPVVSETVLDAAELLAEYLMLRLRLSDGIRFDDYRKKFGTEFTRTYAKAIAKTQKAGLITADQSGIKPTSKGFDLQNALIVEFIKNL